MEKAVFLVFMTCWVLSATATVVERGDVRPSSRWVFIRLASPVEDSALLNSPCPSPRPAEIKLEQLIPRLKGAWRSVWLEGEIRVYWWIDARGNIAEIWQGPGGQKLKRRWRLVWASENQLEVEGDDGHRERWSWLVVDRRRMIVGRNLPGSPPVKWGGEEICVAFVPWRMHLGEKICRVKDAQGRELRSACSWQKARPGKRLTVKFSDADGEPAEATFRLIGGWLVDERLVQSGWFERK